MQNYSRTNKRLKWILIVIDIFSRKSFVEALPNKTTEEVEKRLVKIIKDFKCTPLVIISDDGGKWKGEVQKNIIKKNNIFYRTTVSGDHNLLMLFPKH